MAKRIMIQGTMSGVGKSLLCAGLCRVFRQDGLRVAPFKSQNMALNSGITPQGLEMGRAQIMQAEAAGQMADVRMNPILLKPTGDTGSQLIVSGRVRGNFSAREYQQMKLGLVPDIRAAYNSLAAENDLIVIEGAGSPAEINLRQNDIVNMGLAQMVDAPVLLAGDIDRGGVFAQLYGTAALLTPEEKARLRGVIINKFRGDPEILRPGLAPLEQLCGVPVLGVVPLLRLTLDEEDSLAPELEQTTVSGVLDVAVIKLPHIANFTDFTPLGLQPGVSVRYVDSVRRLGHPDLLILPGSKNTMADLKWLRECGLETALQRLAADTLILGICGGYQMLGQSVSDPQNTEGGGSLRGLGLLPVETVFSGEKARTRVRGRAEELGGIFAALGGAQFSGYEIHMGRTRLLGGQSFARLAPEFAAAQQAGPPQADGCAAGNVLGSYCHGLFDSGDFAARLLQIVRQHKGLAETEAAPFDYAAFKESQYDKLADALRRSLNMDAIYKCMEGQA